MTTLRTATLSQYCPIFKYLTESFASAIIISLCNDYCHPEKGEKNLIKLFHSCKISFSIIKNIIFF